MWHGLVPPAPPFLAQPHSQESDAGTARWQHLHPYSPAAVVPVTIHHLNLQPESLWGSTGAAVGQP